MERIRTGRPYGGAAYLDQLERLGRSLRPKRAGRKPKAAAARKSGSQNQGEFNS